jgi:hypothetical protein
MVYDVFFLFFLSVASRRYWLIPAREHLQQHGLLEEHERWAFLSGRLFLSAAKAEIESLRLAGTVSGFQWWLLTDFWTGSNGILDSFNNPKPGVADNVTDVQSLLAQTVLLTSEPLPLALQGGDVVSVGIVASAYADVPVGSVLRWGFDAGGQSMASGEQVVRTALVKGALTTLANASWSVPQGYLGTFPAGSAEPPQLGVLWAELLPPATDDNVKPRAGQRTERQAKKHLLVGNDGGGGGGGDGDGDGGGGGGSGTTVDRRGKSASGTHREPTMSNGAEVLARNEWTTRVFPSYRRGSAAALNLTVYTTHDILTECPFDDCRELPRLPLTGEPLLSESNVHRRARDDHSDIAAGGVDTTASAATVVLVVDVVPDAAAALVRAGATLLYVRVNASVGGAVPSVPIKYKSAWWLGSAGDDSCGTVVYPTSANITRGMVDEVIEAAPFTWLDPTWHALVDGSQAFLTEMIPTNVSPSAAGAANNINVNININTNASRQHGDGPESEINIMVRALDIATRGPRSKALLMQLPSDRGLCPSCGSRPALATGLNVLQTFDEAAINKGGGVGVGGNGRGGGDGPKRIEAAWLLFQMILHASQMG